MPEMKCPVCGLVLEVDEIYDDDFDNEKREENWYGHCPKCGKEYHWTHIFAYKDTVDFGEVKEDE